MFGEVVPAAEMSSQYRASDIYNLDISPAHDPLKINRQRRQSQYYELC
jgi:hypothetical protein